MEVACRRDLMSGSDCGWVDKVQWTGQVPPPPQGPLPTVWDQLSYSYDPAGRRIEKKYDGTTVVKYLYDGSHCLAEYDGNNNLLRKYIYGPAVDEPISMIDVEHASATYYYHFDGLGSVIALTNSSGATAVLYEYSVYGQVAASDPNHPNRFLFTGREFDEETGLYYYRARYYHPEIGRFLQTDPINYGNAMSAYGYCRNNPVIRVDPSGECDFTVGMGYAYAPTGWDYMVPRYNRKDLPGRPHYRYLVYQYGNGSGHPVWYGDASSVWAWVTKDASFVESMREAIINLANGERNWYLAYHMSECNEPETKYYALASLSGIAFNYQTDWTHYLIHGLVAVYGDLKITISDRGATVKIEGYWLGYDWMDLHPDQYAFDEGAAEFEEYYDRYSWMIGLTEAEPYPLYLDLGFRSVTVSFPENGDPTISGWPSMPYVPPPGGRG